MTFVDLTKGFDTVGRDGLWKIMAKFGCPPRYIAMVGQFNDGMQACVQNDGEYSEPFPVTNGVKQGCVMAPTLFSVMFSAMLTDAFQDVDAGFPIRYRFDGKLLKLRRLQAKSKVQTDVVDKLLYAEKNAKSEENMQGAVDRMSKACDNNCAPLVADLFLFCFERDFMKNLSSDNQADVIKAFNSTSRYLDDLLNIDIPYFEGIFNQIYPSELQLYKANTSDTDALFLDLHLSISNGFVSSKIYDKRDDFDFDIVNFPF